MTEPQLLVLVLIAAANIAAIAAWALHIEHRLTRLEVRLEQIAALLERRNDPTPITTHEERRA